MYQSHQLPLVGERASLLGVRLARCLPQHIR